jgi:hypothetical protein
MSVAGKLRFDLSRSMSRGRERMFGADRGGSSLVRKKKFDRRIDSDSLKGAVNDIMAHQ